MAIHKILDAVFKGLDIIDEVKERIDRILGKEIKSDPWTSEWDKAEEKKEEEAPLLKMNLESIKTPKKATTKKATTKKAATKKTATKKAATKKAATKKTATKKTATKKAATKKTATKKTATKKTATKKTTTRKVVAKKATTKKATTKKRAVIEQTDKGLKLAKFIKNEKITPITPSVNLEGKPLFARVMWALKIAELAGETGGLTTKDVSSLLKESAKINVFSTNVNRIFNSFKNEIVKGQKVGRSQCFKLNSVGQTKAKDLIVRSTS